MILDSILIDRLADTLEQAQGNALEIDKLTDSYPTLDIDGGYRIQSRLRERAIARGARIVGFKMGLTSHAKMQQMGVDTPIHGFLTDQHSVIDGGTIDSATLIHPKAEAELAFVIGKALAGPDCDIAKVLDATICVLPAIELIDSRYRDFRFDLPSVIADNTSASHYVIGSFPNSIHQLDLETLGVVLEKNGVAVETGAGAAVLDNPANAVAMLANMLSAKGEHIPAGSLILSGAVTAAVSIAAGDHIAVRVNALGTVSFRLS